MGLITLFTHVLEAMFPTEAGNSYEPGPILPIWQHLQPPLSPIQCLGFLLLLLLFWQELLLGLQRI